MNRKNFSPPFSTTSLPAWSCPVCTNGALVLVSDKLHIEETTQSKKDNKHPDWEPTWTRQRFAGLLRCSRCNEPVFFTGAVEAVEDYDDEFGGNCYYDTLSPHFFEPALPLLITSNKCPANISAEILAASSLYWSSPSASANRARVAVERLMDDIGVVKKRKTKKGTFETLSLNKRIERFAEKHSKVGEILLAIKWLGNKGSHSDSLSNDDALDGFELLEHALEEIYDLKSSRLQKMSQSINKNKGPIKLN
jgi:hypothetical protein